jgi:cation diffusion facilitator family transporter
MCHIETLSQQSEQHRSDLNHENQNQDIDHLNTFEQEPTYNHEQRTRWVVYLTTVTMVLEIFMGYWTNSMALLAEGYHMASHVFALGLTWIAYVFARKFSKTEHHSFNKKKMLALSGFTSAVILQIVAIIMAIEAFSRFLHPMKIRFSEAIFIASFGLLINALSAVFLHHDYEHHDYNIRSAYIHVLADGITSVIAIFALLAGMLYNLYFLDSISGIISSFVITKWAIDLMRGAGKDLIDFRVKET